MQNFHDYIKLTEAAAEDKDEEEWQTKRKATLFFNQVAEYNLLSPPK